MDLNFWIRLKSCMLGLNGSGDDARLLRLLRSGVAEGRLFCPISESVFFEVLKQSDPSSRMATARLIDELSLGVTLLPNPRRFATEISLFFYSFQEDSELHPISHLVWSKIAYVLDFIDPSSTAFDTYTELVVQKSFFDHMWMMSLSEMLENISDVPDAKAMWLDDIATTLNAGTLTHSGEVRSFTRMWRDELRGAADRDATRTAAKKNTPVNSLL